MRGEAPGAAGRNGHGGLANSWDYRPLGVELKNNVKRAWWKKFVQESPTNVGLDAAIIMNPQTWVTTGHVAGFSDPLLDCKSCKKARHRADKLIGDVHPEINVDAMDFDQMDAFIAEHEDVVCPVCGKHNFTPIRSFNLMFKTAIGVTEDSSSTCYLRPETAQGIFVNFANIQRSTRKKLPFGIGQVGKAFRNEITPGNFTFRTREFEQMECEFFCKPGTDLEWFAYWKDFCANWLTGLGIRKESLRLRDHEPAELAFYSRATTDIEYAFPSPTGESCGALPTAPITIWDGIRRLPAKVWNTLIPKPTNVIFPMSLSRPWAPTGWCWPSCARRMMKRWWTRRKTTPAWCFICIRHWRPSRRRCSPFQEAERRSAEGARPARQTLHGGFRRRRLHRQAVPPGPV